MSIKEYLKEKLGEAYTDEIDKKVGEELGANFVPKHVYAEATEAKKGLEKQLADANKALDDVKKSAGASEELKKELDARQKELDDAKKAHEEELSKIKFDHALETALAAAGAKSSKAVKGFLDTSKLSLDGDNIIGLDEQLKAVKESDGYLFEQKEKNPAPGAGGNPAKHGDNEPAKGSVASGKVYL